MTVHTHDHDHEHDHERHRDVGDHGGYVDTGNERVAVLETILAENDRTADDNRSDFAAAGVVTVNLMSSPGAGKTTLLKRTITMLGSRLRLGVLEGDIATSLDADELERPRRASGAREHRRRLRWRVPPRRHDGSVRSRPAAAATTSTCS